MPPCAGFVGVLSAAWSLDALLAAFHLCFNFSKMKNLVLCAIFLASCARQTFIKPGTLISAGNAKIEKCAICDGQAFFIHFPKEVDFRDFDATIPGVQAVSQNDKHSIIVRVGMAFDQIEVCKKVAKSGGRKTSKV